MLKKRIFLLLVSGLLILTAGKECKAKEIESVITKLMEKIECTCGCGLTLKVCERNDPTCSTRPQIVRQLRRLVEAGKGENEVLEAIRGGVTPSQRAIKQAQKENKFLFLYFYEKGSGDCERMREVIEKAKEKWGNEANFIEIDINDEEEHEVIVEQFGIFRAPITLVMAPNGAITAGFPGVVGLDELEKALVSPKMAEIIQALQKRKVIFLCIQNDEMDEAEEVLRVVNEVGEVLGKSVRVVTVDPTDKREREFLEKIGVEQNTTTPVTVVISQTGGIGDKFIGRLTNRDLLTAFQGVLVSRSGCGGMEGGGPVGGTCE